MSSTPGQRARLAKTQGGICPECKMPLPDDLAKTEVDHVIPRVRGGPDRVWNRRLVHFSCNRSKRFTLTDEAIALAAEHAVILREPKPRSEYRRPEPTMRPGLAMLLGGEPLLFGGEPEWLRDRIRAQIAERMQIEAGTAT